MWGRGGVKGFHSKRGMVTYGRGKDSILKTGVMGKPLRNEEEH